MLKVNLVFANGNRSGCVSVTFCRKFELSTRDGKIDGTTFCLPNGGTLTATVESPMLDAGANSSILRITGSAFPFSAFLRDVNPDYPIYIPEYGVAITAGDVDESYENIGARLASHKLLSDFDRFARGEEESYDSASAKNRHQRLSTWLGLGRDMRMFRVAPHLEECNSAPYGCWGIIQPCFHSSMQKFGELEKSWYQFDFFLGHGAQCRNELTRHLDEGCLPILHSSQIEQNIRYQITTFATLENTPLVPGEVRGSQWECCYANTAFHMLSRERLAEMEVDLKREMFNREQEVVLLFRVEAINLARVPSYAWFKAPKMAGFNHWHPIPFQSKFEPGRVLHPQSNSTALILNINGKSMPQEEMGILVLPGEKVVWDIIVPHNPISEERAAKLADINFSDHLKNCRDYWHDRLQKAAQISLPDKNIDESVKAGLLHCDLVTIGEAKNGPLLATIGWYGPIGTESSPIIQYYDSMGWHDEAERCIEFFLIRQREDGFIQNYNNYESETGALLWTIGEHYRYTHDNIWLKRIFPQVKKAVAYLRKWRDRNKVEDYHVKGFYGLVDGKIADPDDFYHSFFLNAGTYAGMREIGSAYCNIAPEYADELNMEVAKYRDDLRKSLEFAMGTAPVMPTADGSWVPVPAGWVESNGACCLYANGGNFWTHGSFLIRDSLIGAMWLIYAGVFEADELISSLLIKGNGHPFTLDNAASSQPYYGRHDYIHLKRGDVGAYLKTYFNQLTGLQDRETRTFWEHYYHCGQHKTHEEAWFLMQTRWMLYFEEDDSTLSLLKMIPREQLGHGRIIKVERAKCYFGAISFMAESRIDDGEINFTFECFGDYAPKILKIRLPHPLMGIKASNVSGGIYDTNNETVILPYASGKIELAINF
jgi:hypothetical protein